MSSLGERSGGRLEKIEWVAKVRLAQSSISDNSAMFIVARIFNVLMFCTSTHDFSKQAK